MTFLRFLLALPLLSLQGCTRPDAPHICVVFPANYVGWTIVRYNIAGAPRLPVREGCTWLDFTANHDLRTQEVIIGWVADKFVESRDGKLQTMSRRPYSFSKGMFISGGYESLPADLFFVGTAEQRKAIPPPSLQLE